MTTERDGRQMALVLLGVLAVGPASVFIRLCEAPAMPVAAYRLAFATALLLPVVAVRGFRDFRGFSGRTVGLSVVSGLLLALHFGCWIASLYHTSVANSVLLVTTQPIFAALFAVVFLGERIRPRVLIGIALAMAGAAVIGGGDLGGGHWYGDLLALLGAIWAAAYWTIGRTIRTGGSGRLPGENARRTKGLPVLGYVTLTYGSCAVFLLIATPLLGEPLSGFPAATWGWIALMALTASVIGHTLFNRALAHSTAYAVSTAILGEPVVATVLAGIFLAEWPATLTLLGAVPLAVGVVIVLSSEKTATDGQTRMSVPPRHY